MSFALGDNLDLGKTTLAGQPVSPSSVLVMYAFAGDTNLDGMVDVTDLAVLATHWQSVGNWTEGDFNYTGGVDITDLALLATNWQAGVTNPLPSGSFEQALAALGLTGVAVPEPASCGSTFIGAMALLRRKRSLLRTKLTQ